MLYRHLFGRCNDVIRISVIHLVNEFMGESHVFGLLWVKNRKKANSWFNYHVVYGINLMSWVLCKILNNTKLASFTRQS